MTDLQTGVKLTMSIKMERGEAIYPFMENVARAYEEAEFTEQRKLVFLFKVAFDTKHTRQFVVLHTSKTFSELVNSAYEHKQLERRFFT